MCHVRIACNAKGTWRQGGWTDWWVWRLAGGKATGAGWWVWALLSGEPFGAPPLKPLSSGERLRGSSLGPCPTRSALEPPRSAPDEGGAFWSLPARPPSSGERLGGSSLGPSSGEGLELFLYPENYKTFTFLERERSWSPQQFIALLAHFRPRPAIR